MNAPANIVQQVSRYDPADTAMCARIEGFVRERCGSLFHRPAWLNAVANGTGQQACGLVAQQFGAVTGWLPLTAVRSILFGKALVSSGFGVGGGILADSEEVIRVLAQSAQDHARRGGFASVELRGGPIPAEWRAWDDKHCGFQRALAVDDEAELLAIPRKARAEVRKGLNNGLTVRIGTGADDLAAHYAAYSESVRNLGTPVFPKRLFRAMIEAFPGTSDILTVSDGDKPIASVLSFYHHGAVMPFWGGGSFAARAARANELMYYELMLHARRQGMQSFDFGRSKAGSGPHHFKKNWGFDPVPLTYGEWTAGGARARDVDPTSAAYSDKIELWKKLPLPLANVVGPLIARGLA